MTFHFPVTFLFPVKFGGSEAIITALSDEYEVIRKNREIFVACLFSFYFIVGLTTCTEGGVYIFQLLDSYAAGHVSAIDSSLFISGRNSIPIGSQNCLLIRIFNLNFFPFEFPI